MRVRRPRVEVWLCSVTGLASSVTASFAQARGLPLFFDATYSYQARAGIDLGNGGESGGLVIVAGGSHLIRLSHRDRLGLSAAVGYWNLPGSGRDGLNAGLTASYLLNRFPRPTSAPNPTYRAFAGGGFTRVAGRTIVNAPVGLQAGYLVPWAVARVEPWITLRAHYLESLRIENRSSWRVAVSTGVNLGVASRLGARAAADFGSGRVGFGGGVSLWW